MHFCHVTSACTSIPRHPTLPHDNCATPLSLPKNDPPWKTESGINANRKNHTTWGLIFQRNIHYTHWTHPAGKMIQKTLPATSHDNHPDTTPSPSHPKDEPRHWNPGRTPSPAYSTTCQSATWNLQNTPDTRLYPTTKCATLLFLPMIDTSSTTKSEINANNKL